MMGQVTCNACGVLFTIPEQFEAALRSNHQRFYCPSGHSLKFTGENKYERLQRHAGRLQISLDERNRRVVELENSNRALRAWCTRYRRIIAEMKEEE